MIVNLASHFERGADVKGFQNKVLEKISGANKVLKKIFELIERKLQENGENYTVLSCIHCILYMLLGISNRDD